MKVLMHITLCDTCYDTGVERINSSHSNACLMCYGLGTAPTWSFCEEHNTYGLHAYCEYCDYFCDVLDDISQLQHECILDK